VEKVDFAEYARITVEADNALQNILSKQYDNFDMYAEVSRLDDLEVAKLIIKRLLDKLN